MTVVETRRAMAEAGEHWRIPLMDFVDDVRRRRDAAAVAQPFALTGDRLDALLAAVVDALCAELDWPTPGWVETVPPPPRAWFVSGVESLKALALAQSPVPFRRKRIFVLDNFLTRV